MRVLSKLVLAAIALGALTTSASAVTIVHGAATLANEAGLSTNPGPGSGEVIVWNFNTGGTAIEDTTHFSFTGNIFIGLTPNIAAPPAGDTSRYGVALVGTDATFQTKGVVLTSLSIDLGSLDAQNRIDFFSGNTLEGSFTGTTLAGALAGVANGNQHSDLTNGRFYFTFSAADDITKLVFSTTKPSFEFDNIAATFSAVPEPATWTMLILGFGFVGFMMRSSRQRTATVIA